VDARSAPQWILAAHRADQFPNLLRNRRPPGPTVANLPGPEQAKALAMPCDHGLRFDDDDAGAPIGPNPRYPRPEKPVRGSVSVASPNAGVRRVGGRERGSQAVMPLEFEKAKARTRTMPTGRLWNKDCSTGGRPAKPNAPWRRKARCAECRLDCRLWKRSSGCGRWSPVTGGHRWLSPIASRGL
jgi:hypothetical protein